MRSLTTKSFPMGLRTIRRHHPSGPDVPFLGKEIRYLVVWETLDISASPMTGSPSIAKSPYSLFTSKASGAELSFQICVSLQLRRGGIPDNVCHRSSTSASSGLQLYLCGLFEKEWLPSSSALRSKIGARDRSRELDI